MGSEKLRKWRKPVVPVVMRTLETGYVNCFLFTALIMKGDATFRNADSSFGLNEIFFLISNL